MGSTPTYGAVTVQSTSTLILASNPSRRGCLIANNDSSATLYLGFDSSVTSSNGMPILAGSTLQNSDDSALWKGQIYGVTATGTIDARYWEWNP